MKGTNKLVKPDYHPEGDLRVNEIFDTIQGEGPQAGRRAVFVRLTGCNLRCYFCDTEFDEGEVLTAREVRDAIVALKTNASLVVITGGEPLLQQILPLVVLLHQIGFTTQVETAGTVAPPPTPSGLTMEEMVLCGALQLVCSPKTATLHPDIRRLCSHFKYVVRYDDEISSEGLPMSSTQKRGDMCVIASAPCGSAVYMQPMADDQPDITRANMLHAVNLCMKYGYRLSLQQHKIAGVK